MPAVGSGALAKRVRERLAQLERAPALDVQEARYPADAPERLVALAQLVCSWGKRINLSGHRSPEQICDRLILDAAALATVLPPFESLADLGSGAGFPGLPIAILYPEARVILVEARQRRHHFQRAAVRELELTNAHPLLGRIEELEPEPCAVALAQAVAPAVQVAEWIRPWSRAGGTLAIPASEATSVPRFPEALGSVRAVEYRVPEGVRRKLWLLQIPS